LKVASHTGAKFSVRDYRPTDFDTVWEIDQRCFPPGISYSKLELGRFLARQNAVALVAEFQKDEIRPGDSPVANSDHRIAGFVVAHSIRHKYGRILTLDIVPEARRAGLGTTLMSACEERLQSLGCGAVYLETAVNNESALRLYRKLGYEVLDILPRYYASHSLDAFQMGKRLA
jgi:ribosomal-protein-alanine N-acetyltransferase